MNDISNDGIGFQSDKNEVTLLSRNNEAFTLPLASKKRIAADILKLVWK